MWVEAQDHSLLNLDMAKSIFVDFTEQDGYSIFMNDNEYLLGVYKDVNDAVFVHREIVKALQENHTIFIMPTFKRDE